MTPAKPQQMSGQKDDPDDLIAELAKLMATETKSPGGDSPKPATPANEVRIPGQQTIRIPGMNQPVSAGNPAPPPLTPGKFDFGQPARPATAKAAEPRSGWQERLGSRPASGADPLASFELPPKPAPSSPSNWRPAIPPGETDKPATPVGAAFDFDFGFNRERPTTTPPKPAPAPVPVPRAPVAPAAPAAASPAANTTPAAAPPVPKPPAPARDPIAELIAAELGAEMRSAPAYPLPGSSQPSAIPSRPGSTQRQAPESDKFTTAPVFGLTGETPPSPSAAPAPPAPAPKAEVDPMDEIESLIGEAVRVELNMPQPAPRTYEPPVARAPQPAAQPAVPPLGTQFAPRRTTGLRDTDSGIGSADEAILAAAAATGQEVGRVDAPFADERPMKSGPAPKQKKQRQRLVGEERPRSTFRQIVVPALAGMVLVAGGLALYWELGMTHGGGEAPVLKADVTPAKTIPAKPASTAPHSVVMDELSGNTPAKPKETLVSRDQTAAGAAPVQVATATPAAQPAAPAASVPTAAPPGSTDGGEGGLANRKVRTVTVRPDGTIVSSDDTVAGAAQLPVSRPNVPAVPGAAVASAGAGTSVITPAVATPASTPTAEPAAALAPAAGTDTAANTDPAPADATAPEAADAAASVDAPVPLPPPDRATEVASADPAPAAQTVSPRPTSAVNAVIKSGNPGGAQPVDLLGDSTSTPTRPAPARVANVDSNGGTAASSGGGHVQLSSQTSQAAAQASANTLLKRYGNLWGGTKLQIVRADLGSKGVYYRVILPTASSADAVALCSTIKANGGQCVANR